MVETRPFDREILLARNDALWNALESAFEGASSGAEQPPADGGWSAADHLAHVVTWERPAWRFSAATTRPRRWASTRICGRPATTTR